MMNSIMAKKAISNAIRIDIVVPYMNDAYSIMYEHSPVIALRSSSKKLKFLIALTNVMIVMTASTNEIMSVILFSLDCLDVFIILIAKKSATTFNDCALVNSV
ncbi:hypothetical protein MYOV011v1_p0004 [Vibrio phage 6E35.1a]|nr:hypothetical protein MYOV011v1_p0004 [Vibrio phage 6E35.1a]